MTSPLRLPAALLVAAMLLAGCGRGHDHDHGSAGAAAHGGGHVHAAPHGGVLVELGDHQYNLELVADAEGTRIYVLGAHAETFVRIEAPMLRLRLETPAGPLPWMFGARPDAATGERVGDTARFDASPLPPGTDLSGRLVLEEITVRGSTFREIELPLARARATAPAAATHPH